ncbi:MAG: diguanylate cyclase [Candidatus Aegiribacteria sp.]|nr:diguanylate cyclase [Candidatus Aegiribacteria sp.]
MEKTDSDNGNRIGIDPLTGLHDRSYLDGIKDEYLRKDRAWSLLMLDIDHFKLINDIYGHLSGDRVLHQLALTIQVNLKKTDTAIRFGGDEFMIILPDTAGEGALDLAQRLIYEAGRMSFPSGLHISLSIGVSQSRESDGSILELVSRSDKALYRAKEAGRGRVFFFTEDLLDTEAPEISSAHMVGRRPELQKLRQMVEESVTETSRFAVITGEAGVGKSRLVDELLNYCSFMKMLVVKYSAMEHIRRQPYSLLVEPLKDAISELSDREMDVIRRQIEPVHPATLELFPEFEASIIDDTIYFREERLRFRIFRDIAVLISAISTMRPLMFILDNLQWASEQDIGILSFVARNTPDAHVFYLCQMRKDKESETRFKRLAAIRSSIPLLVLDIPKLTMEETRNLLLFSLKDPNIPKEAQDFLISQSGGNPLFLRELLIACIDSGYITADRSGEKIYNIPDDIAIPESLGQIITSKLSNISDEARDLLKIASLSPDHFNLALLEGLTGNDQVVLARGLDKCIKAGLIEEVREGKSEISFRFTHGAVRDFLSSELPDSLRLTYNQRIAGYFEEFYNSGKEDLLTTVAYHYARSQDDSNAGRFAFLAAEQAFSRGANRDAIAWYSVFIERTDEKENDAELMFKVHINLGEIFSITGNIDMADEHLKQALELSKKPVELAAVHLRLGKNYLNSSRYPETLDSFGLATELCQESGLKDIVALRIFIEALIETSFICRLKGQYPEALSNLDRVAELLKESSRDIQDDIMAQYYTRRADIISEIGSIDRALGIYSKALDIYRKTEDLPGEATVLNNMHGIYLRQGEYAKSLNTMEEVIRINLILDDRLGLAIANYNIAEYYQSINMLDLAREYYDKYLEINDDIENELGFGYGSYGLGNLYWLEGRFEKSRLYFEEAIEVFTRLHCDEIRAECKLMIVQICMKTEKFESAKEILRLLNDEGSFSSGTEDSILFVKGLVYMSSPDTDAESLNQSVECFRQIIESSQDNSEIEIALYYSSLATAYGKLDLNNEMKKALKTGSRNLADKLGRIQSYSIRNSIMTRREIVEFKALCSKCDVTFPPDGYAFDRNR